MELDCDVKIYDEEGLVTDPTVYPCHDIRRAVLQFNGPMHGRVIEVELPERTFARSDEIERAHSHLITEGQGWVFQESYDAIARVKLPKEYGFDLLIAPQGFVFESC